MDTGAILHDFPNLRNSGWRITSDADEEYNCIAWAAEDSVEWWWPEPDKFWPAEAPREETIDAFVAALGTVGFLPCENADLETGMQKVAIFAFDDQPTHAARQLPKGNWTSKLGKGCDIEHDDSNGASGAFYGFPVRFLKRPSRKPLIDTNT